ncbi:MAG: helix-turn-helix transcriptional regulator [Bacteroidetes bacterium]|nr:helix-turn-helix transcriptional regulator [Bacteroidota bacterium]
MIEDINKRVIHLLDAYNYSKSQFALELGISLSILTHISSGRNKPGLDMIQKILAHFTDLNPDWLLHGTGDMKRNKPKSIDMTSELEQLKSVSAELAGFQSGINQVLDYHKILYEEIAHLQTLSHNITKMGQKQKQLTERIQDIENSILSKLKD